MIKKEKIVSVIQAHMQENDFFIVTLDVDTKNRIRLMIDSMKGINLGECIAVSRLIESGLNREEEDFDLEVSSPGLDEPFIVLQQYQKNIGADVSVILKNGSLLKGSLVEADSEKIRIEEYKEENSKGKKNRKKIIGLKELHYDEISKVKKNIIF